MAQQSEANNFALHLPALAPALRDKLEKWGSRECRQLSIEPEGEGVNIYVERKAKTTALKLQRNVRGIAANSGAPLPPTLGKGWLVPLSPEEWNARVAETPAVPEPPFPPEVPRGCGQTHTELSADFDERANDLLRELQTQTIKA